MEVFIKGYNWPAVISFDGHVLETFVWSKGSEVRFHIRQITSIQLSPADKHGNLQLTCKVAGGYLPTQNLGQIAPDEVGEVQQLVAAVQQAIHTP